MHALGLFCWRAWSPKKCPARGKRSPGRSLAILTEPALFDELAELLVRGREDADVGVPAAGGAERVDLAFLQNAQELRAGPPARGVNVAVGIDETTFARCPELCDHRDGPGHSRVL